jgi:hypothetical protein
MVKCIYRLILPIFALMSVHAFCSHIHDINFSDHGHLVGLLSQDKHTRIEGLCSEAAFAADVLAGNFPTTTSDFWFTRAHNSWAVTRIVTDALQPLSPLDYRLLDGLATRIPVSIAWFSYAAASFYGFLHHAGNRYPHGVEGMGHQLVPVPNPVIAPPDARDPIRLRKACAYLAGHGLLRASAVRRLFANCWLGRAVWDIDAFTITPTGKVVALEVKQKYPTARGTFGLNQGQEQLFRFLNSLGMPVIHVILAKPVSDSSIHATDLLTLPQYTANTQWLYTRFVPSRLQQAIAAAPAYTSIFGTGQLSYSHIPRHHFTVLKPFGIPTPGIANTLLAGIE